MCTENLRVNRFLLNYVSHKFQLFHARAARSVIRWPHEIFLFTTSNKMEMMWRGGFFIGTLGVHVLSCSWVIVLSEIWKREPLCLCSAVKIAARNARARVIFCCAFSCTNIYQSLTMQRKIITTHTHSRECITMIYLGVPFFAAFFLTRIISKFSTIHMKVLLKYMSCVFSS
jgi:hypothetical protein